MQEPLSDKEKEFVKRYLESIDKGKKPKPTKIAKEVGLLSDGKKAFHLTPKIKKAIQEVTDTTNAELDIIGVTRARIIETLYKIASVDARKFFNDDGTLKNVNEWDEDVGLAISSIETYKDGRIKTIRLWDKVKSLELLGKQAGMFVDRVEVKTDIIDKIREGRERIKKYKVIETEAETEKKENDNEPS